VRSPRRYYLLKRLAARRDCLEEGVWQDKQEAVGATALPDDFPYRAELAVAGYTTADDVDGATPDELLEFAGLDSRAAAFVIAAVAAV
jgi:hypothetical protein